MSLIYGTFMHWLPWAGTQVTLSHFGGHSWRGCRKHHCFYCCRGAREPFPGTGFLGGVWWSRGNRAGWVEPKSGSASCLFEFYRDDSPHRIPTPSATWLLLNVRYFAGHKHSDSYYEIYTFCFLIWFVHLSCGWICTHIFVNHGTGVEVRGKPWEVSSLLLSYRPKWELRLFGWGTGQVSSISLTLFSLNIQTFKQ